ncbi:MAG: hypothetical protein E7012_02115 [Alphaproteobacteria bacterium]|nr:hypothetical protein [Alphaproteobacteria bacterium]
MNKYVISVSILLLSASSSLAQDSCMVRPSCADMGYTKSATDCEGKKAISCPFDLSAYYCPEVGESCDFSEYPLTECPTGGNCTEFECGGTTQYKLDGCQNSYELSSDGLTCNACNFANYPLSNCDANGTCSDYKCGNVTKYKLDSCKSGYNKKGNTCEYDPCYHAEHLDCLNNCADYDNECGVCLECDCSGCVDGCEHPGLYDEGCGCYDCLDEWCDNVCYQGSCSKKVGKISDCDCYEYCCDDVEYDCLDWCENGYQESWHSYCFNLGVCMCPDDEI